MTRLKQVPYTDETSLRAPREVSIASSATPTPDVDTTDLFILTALAEAAHFSIPTGAPANGQKLLIRIKDNGTARNLTWDAIYSSDNLPSKTVASNTRYLICIYNSAAVKWDVSVQGDETSMGGGYNFLETTPSSDTSTAAESMTITGLTMRCNGTGVQSPVVTVNGVPVTVTQTVGDLNVYSFSIPITLNVGANSYLISSDNGAVLNKTLVITRSSVAPSCVLTHAAYLGAGAHTITMTTDYDLIATPTLVASIGSLSAFSGSGKVWTATLTITAENGNGVFSSASMVGDGGTGTTINSGASYVVDTVAPVIGTANFSTTIWHGGDASMSVTIAMGEPTTGFTGYIDLSAFGLSSTRTLSSSGNNLVASFSPARVDAGPEHGTNINASDRAGNPSTPKAETDNQLQVIAYRVVPQNVTFAAYSAVSGEITGTFTTDSNSHVAWGAGQVDTGILEYTTDYVIDTHNKIHLDEVKWSTTIAANALGMLNIDIYED
jgi:hypothetical protein